MHRGRQPPVGGQRPRRPRPRRRSRPPSPDIEPLLSTSRHSARRCAVPGAGDQSSLGRGGQGPDQPSRVRSRSRSPVAARRGPSRRVPRAGSGRPGRAGRTPARPAAARRRAAPGRWRAPGRPAARPRRPGRRPAARRTRPASSSPDLGRDVVERRVPGGQLGAADRAPGRRPGRRSRRRPRRMRGWPAAARRRAVSFSPAVRARPVAGARPLRRSAGGGPAARAASEQLVEHRLRACGRSRRRSGSARTARRSAASRAVVPRHAVVGSPRSLASAGQQQHQVDRAAHRRAHPHVAVLAGGPGQRRPRSPTSLAVDAGHRGGDHPLARRRPGSRARPGTSGRRWPG